MRRLLQTVSFLVFSILTVFIIQPIDKAHPSSTQAAAGDPVNIEKLSDVANSSYFVDPAATGASLTLAGNLQLKEVTAPATPGTGKVAFYAKADKGLYIKNDTGKESNIQTAMVGAGAVPKEKYNLLQFLAGLFHFNVEAAAGDPINIERLNDVANSSYFVDPAATGIALSLAGNLQLTEAAAPATPATGKIALYVKTDKGLYMKDDTGKESLVAGSGVTNVLMAKYETSGSAIGSATWLFDHQGGTIVVGWCNGGDHYFFDNSGSSVTFAGVGLTLLKTQRFFSNNSDDRPRVCEWWWNSNIAAQQANFVVTFANAHVAEFWAYGFTLGNVAGVGNSGGGERNDDLGAGNLTYAVTGQNIGNLILSIVASQNTTWSETSGATLIEKDDTMGGSNRNAGLYSRVGTGAQTFTYNYSAGPEAVSAAIEFVP